MEFYQNSSKYPSQLSQTTTCWPDYKMRKEFIKEIMDYLQSRPYAEVNRLMQELERAYVQTK